MFRAVPGVIQTQTRPMSQKSMIPTECMSLEATEGFHKLVMMDHYTMHWKMAILSLEAIPTLLQLIFIHCLHQQMDPSPI